MADTWRAIHTSAVAYASAKDMLDVLNASGSGRVLRVYRCYAFNLQTATVTGVATTVDIIRITNATAGTSVTPIAHDTNNTSLAAQITAGTGRTLTGNTRLRRVLMPTDEAAAGGTSWDEWYTLVPVAEIWNAGYGDSAIQPLVLREGYGLSIYHSGSTAVGNMGPEIEFTNAAS